MLSEISIRNVVLIQSLDLELKTGLTAMTGETGAGKSIILDALGMATGARSDKGLVRTGAEKAQCSARFNIPNEHAVWSLLDEAGIDYEVGDDLVLRRIVGIDGRSRAYINDSPAGQKLLAEIGAHMLEVHGQHDGRGLLDSTTHIHLLDKFGGLSGLVTQCSQCFATLKQARDEVKTLEDRQEKSASDRDYFEYAIAELDRLAPTQNEDQTLATERRLLQHSQGAVSELKGAQQALRGDGEHQTRMGQALAGLERIRTKIGGDDGNTAITSLKTASAALEKVLIELEEARNAVDHAAQVFEFEPGRLDIIEERLFALRAAARKYEVDVNGLKDLRKKFGDEMLALEHFTENLSAAIKRQEVALNAYDQSATTLTKARKKAARKLDKNVTLELPPLKMQNARFVTRIESGAESSTGRDNIVFEVSTNPGTPFGPLGKIASGGELSRLSLAIKVALLGVSSEVTNKVMVFDEVDSGVGGAVADAVGKRLDRLAKQGQVLVVTHSPQVAACADHQLLIHKASKKDETLTSVDVLQTSEREEEIARMLAGESITDAARAAARQLMQNP